MSDTPNSTDDPSATTPTASDGPRVRRSSQSRWSRAKRKERHAARSPLKRRLTRGAIAFVLLVVLLVGGGVIYVEVELGSMHTVAVSNLRNQGSNPADDILLVGSTSRCAVTSSAQLKQFQKECAAGVNGVNSDVIMILRLQPGQPPSLLSIPRDTFVPNARSGGLYNKIDAALADGPSQLVAAVQQDFGIPINHYVVLNFGTFENIVTALGGISMYFPTTLRDFSSNLSIDHTGCVHISGVQALALVRARHLYFHYDHRTKTWLGYDGSGDIGRIERVHIFLKALAAEVASRGLANPITDAKLLAAIAPDLTVDTTFSRGTMLNLVRTYHSSVGNAPEYTLPVVEDSVTYSYKGYPYGLVVFPTEPQDQQTVKEFLGKKAAPKRIATSKITVSVVDGTGSSTATAATAASLRSLGYKVLGTGAQTSVGPVSESTIVYPYSNNAQTLAKNLANAEQVKRSLSGLVVLGQGPTILGADVTVITGSNFAVNTPAATTTSATTATTSQTVLATLLSAVLDAAAGTPNGTAALAAPTSATSSIPPFDPRVCPTKSK
jgi:LCP family protein required for cell wall assembly